MFPEIIELTSSQNLILEELQENMEQMGFELSFLGNNSWSVNSVPSSLKGLDVKNLIHEVVDSVVSGGNSITAKITELIALSSAKTAAIQYGQSLNDEDMATLVNNLLGLKESKYTPDGKTIIRTIPLDEILKMFS